jgi:hypothetical protein
LALIFVLILVYRDYHLDSPKQIGNPPPGLKHHDEELLMGYDDEDCHIWPDMRASNLVYYDLNPEKRLAVSDGKFISQPNQCVRPGKRFDRYLQSNGRNLEPSTVG